MNDELAFPRRPADEEIAQKFQCQGRPRFLNNSTAVFQSHE
jgi:hypothetical protein